MSNRPSLEQNDFWSLYPEYKVEDEDLMDGLRSGWAFPKKKKRSVTLDEDTVALIKETCDLLRRKIGTPLAKRDYTIQLALRGLVRTFLGPDHETI